MLQKPASLKRHKMLRFGIGVLGLALLLPVFIKSEPVGAETLGGTCIAATQDSYDKLIADFGDRYSDVVDPNKTQVILKAPAAAADADVVCIPDLHLKGVIVSGATAATDVTFADIKVLSPILLGYSSDIVNLIGVEYIQQLANVYLEHNNIVDITPLASLSNLEELSIYYNNVVDITPLTSLTKLTELDLEENQISDITALTGLTNLIRLYLGGNQISDISDLAGLINLEVLFLGGNQVSNPAVVAGLVKLEDLDLGYCNVADTSFLAGLINLRYLSLSTNQVSDITPLTNLTNLDWLYLDKNQISDISPLAGLNNLTLLDVSVNPLSDISVLAGLTNLTNLYLNENQISDISPLAGLTNLEALGLNSNQVSDVSVLTHLTKLYELDLRANRISDVSSIAAIYQVIQSSSNPWAYFSAADQKALINVVDTSATVTNPLRRFDGTAIQPNSVDTTYAKYDSGTNQFSLFNLSKAAPTKFADFQFNCARQPSDDPATTVCFSGTLSARYNSNTLTLGGAPKSGVSTANHNAITLSIATLGLGAIALAIVKQRKAHFKK